MTDFKRDFPKFCKKHNVGCKIESTKGFWFWQKDRIEMTLEGTEADTKIIEGELNKLLKWPLK